MFIIDFIIDSDSSQIIVSSNDDTTDSATVANIISTPSQNLPF